MLRELKSNANEIKIQHLDILEYPSLEREALATVRESFSTMRNHIEDCIDLGRKLMDLKYSLSQEHGKEAGEKKFFAWLRTSDWGAYGGGWALTSIRLAEFWQKLAPKTQEWVLVNLQKLSKGAIKRFSEATEIGIDFCLGLVERGVKGTGLDRALKSRKLKVGERVQVVDGFRKGYTGQVIEVTDEFITIEFGDGKQENYAPEQLEKQKGFGKKKTPEAKSSIEEPTPIHNFNAGDRVVVIEDDRGWKGSGGTVVAEWEREPGNWWVHLDEVVAQGDNTKHLYKASQLRLMTVEEMSGKKSIPNDPVVADTSSTVGDQRSRSVEGTTSSSQPELYTKEQVDEMLAQKEREMMESFIGSKSKLREEVELEVKEEIAIGYKLRDKLQAEKQQLIQQLEETNQMLRSRSGEASVQPLAEENEQLKTRIADLERALSDKGTSWNQPVFNQEAVKVMDKELVRIAEGLSNQVEELEKVCSSQQRTIEELKANPVLPTPVQVQEVRKLTEKTEQLEMQLKKYQKAEKEAEELDSKLAPIAVEKLGISDWRKGENGEKCRGLSAILNFAKKLVTSNQNWEKEMAF